jgi:hypothetical protein
MNWNTVLTTLWTLANSPAVIALAAAALLYGLNKLYARKPTWQAFEGTIIAAVKWAEKQIPDDSPNKSLARLNAALGYVIKVYEQARGVSPDPAVTAELREGIQIIHAELEAAGNLDRATPGVAPTPGVATGAAT